MQNCRACGHTLINQFLDLGKSPPSNAYINDADTPETYFPLKVMVCENCWLVQTLDYARPDDLFDSNYAYLSSTSATWLEHCREYAQNAIESLGLNVDSQVIEIAANDGYLLEFFRERNIPNIGVEPTASTANIAKSKGLNIIQDFFGEKLGQDIAIRYGKADLVIANNVFAHVPDIVDFTLGIGHILKKDGVVSLEFPSLLNLIQNNLYDTVYHEHFSYLSLVAVKFIVEKCNLKIIDVEKIKTHGGSYRVWLSHSTSNHDAKASVNNALNREILAGIKDINFYGNISIASQTNKLKILEFLVSEKLKGNITVAYGAAAKGNTVLNFCGADRDLITAVFDNSAEKINKFLPGSNVPILPLAQSNDFEINNVIILPWNLTEELMQSFNDVYNSDVQFYRLSPELEKI